MKTPFEARLRRQPGLFRVRLSFNPISFSISKPSFWHAEAARLTCRSNPFDMQKQPVWNTEAASTYPHHIILLMQKQLVWHAKAAFLRAGSSLFSLQKGSNRPLEAALLHAQKAAFTLRQHHISHSTLHISCPHSLKDVIDLVSFLRLQVLVSAMENGLPQPFKNIARQTFSMQP